MGIRSKDMFCEPPLVAQLDVHSTGDQEVGNILLSRLIIKP